MNPTNLTLPAGGFASSTLTVSSSTANNYIANITVTGGTITHSVSMTVFVNSQSLLTVCFFAVDIMLVLCTHPLLREGALKRMKAAGVLKVVGTDTIPSPVSKVSIAPVLARALKSLT